MVTDILHRIVSELSQVIVQLWTLCVLSPLWGA